MIQQVGQVQGETSAPGSPPLQPDVLVMHSNGVLVGYNATVNTDQARGQALLGALANLSTGDSIYLEGETYNISTAPSGILFGGPSDAVTNVNLYGAGKYATKIVGNQNLNFDPGISSTVSDLSVYDMDYQQFTSSYGDDIIRNVYWQGYIDAIYLHGTPSYGPYTSTTIR